MINIDSINVKISLNSFFLIVFTAIYSVSSSQINNLDSLQQVIKVTRQDSIKINTLLLIGEIIAREKPDSALFYNKKALELIEKNKDISYSWKQLKKGFVLQQFATDYYYLESFNNALSYSYDALTFANKEFPEVFAETYSLKITMLKAKSLEVIGDVYYKKNKYDDALRAYSNSFKLYENIDSKTNQGNILIQIGYLYSHQSLYPRAYYYFSKALKVFEEQKNYQGQANANDCIALIYYEQAEYKDALLFYFKALEYNSKIKNNDGIAQNLGNIGMVYVNINENEKALEYCFKAQRINNENKNIKGVITNFINIGNVYQTQNQYTKALEYYFKTLKLIEGDSDQSDEVICLYNIGETYFSKNDYALAEIYYKKANLLATKINYLKIVDYSLEQLSLLYQTIGRFELALEYYKKHVSLKDSVFNIENTKKLIQQEYKFNYEKKAAAASVAFAKESEIKNAQLLKQKAELKLKRNEQYALYGGVALSLLFAGFMFNRFKLISKQKHTIESKEKETQFKNQEILYQKHLVDEKQKEIIESFTYAKRLQEAILPPIEFVTKFIPENFIFYKPKDIVAGDFYWAENINDLFFVAVADSTGHGVPGAMVSVVCSNALNRAVKEFKLTETGKILDKTRELVVQTFEKSTNEVKDGMDISLLCFNKKERKIFWSGANNPLWYISNQDLKEIKADKQPIGKTDNPKPFVTNELEFKGGTCLYLFTDGFADQFGGEKGKKLKNKYFSEFLVKNSQLEMNKQLDAIVRFFNDWKGELEQVDDICVIGIKI